MDEHPKDMGILGGLGLYLSRQASNPWRYLLEQALFFLLGWVPTIAGIGLRGIIYRLILKMDGWTAIESGVRLRFASLIRRPVPRPKPVSAIAGVLANPPRR